MNHKFRFNDKSIFFNKDSFITFQYKIENLLVFPTSLIVLLEPDSSMDERNVFCYAFDKSFKWQIPQPASIHGSNYYSSIYITDDELYAYSVSGVEYHLNVETGEIIKSELIK